MSDDRVVLDVYSASEVLADDTRRPAVAGHRAGVWVCVGHLGIVARLQLLLEITELAYPLLQSADLLRQALRLTSASAG